MPLALFAGARVADFKAALPWYEQLLGGEPSFFAHETEAVWELAENRSVFIHEAADPGGAEHTVLVDDLDAWVEEVAGRGLEVSEWETYSNGVRKAIYRDADGNELGFAGLPQS